MEEWIPKIGDEVWVSGRTWASTGRIIGFSEDDPLVPCVDCGEHGVWDARDLGSVRPLKTEMGTLISGEPPMGTKKSCWTIENVAQRIRTETTGLIGGNAEARQEAIIKTWLETIRDQTREEIAKEVEEFSDPVWHEGDEVARECEPIDVVDWLRTQERLAQAIRSKKK